MYAGRTNSIVKTGGTTSTQTKEVKATSFPTVVSPDSGYALSQATVTAPDNLTAENIKKDVTIAGVTGTYAGSGGGQLDDRAKFWMRASQNSGTRYDVNDHLLPFVLLKEYWPDRLQYYEVDSLSQSRQLALSSYCCAGLRLDRVELPEGKGTDGVTVIPFNAFYMAGPYEYGDAEFKYMTVTGGETETYQFQTEVFKSARLSDVPDINYYQNTLPESAFPSAVFYTCNVPEGITTIANNALTSITIETDATLRLPSTLTAINGYAAISGRYAHPINIVLKSATPPTLQNSTGIQTNSVDQIVVPAGTLEAYRTATNWSALADKMVEATADAGTTEAGA